MKRETRQTQELQLTSATALDEIDSTNSFTNQTAFISVRCLQKILLRTNRGLDDDGLLFCLTLPLWRSVLALVGHALRCIAALISDATELST